MNRSHIFDACEEHLSVLATRIALRGKLNILNLHLHCEDFYAGLLNRLYSLQLKNMNVYVQNAEGIDLIDAAAKVVLQVSATATKQKVNAALSKDLSAYKGHSFRFMSVSKDASHLRTETFANPHQLVFNPTTDVYDVASLLHIILHLDLSKQREVYAYLQEELSELGGDRILQESNLASIINVIAKENLTAKFCDTNIADFNVDEKIVFNKLDAAASMIEDYKVYSHIVDRIYTEFDNSGVNKSKSVLDTFRNIYLRLSTKYSGDELFFQIVEEVTKNIRGSSNFSRLPIEELSLSVNVIAVDAFIRCKIFKKPSSLGASHVTT
ncbi:SMEK domain-containing protein [Delftia tsuruhatensis]|uniref:ABC-three component system protein n=1 Tax=Delftia tsuruhatensis TaxID=180282 RepID=UPI0009B96C86|nr:ABC-three component system protein [Delftia tsuruhatensis]MDH2234308.1 SMEK domain-containing protein [Delftia tsuruhatensis]